MYILFLRTTILYLLVILVMRLMGKRQIGELQPYEFVITIMISDLASLPMQDSRLPLLLGIIPIITLLLLKILISQLQLKCQFARRVIEGEPSILIYKSKINYNALKSQQINIDELMEEIRLAGYFDLEEINYAILETNGNISILPKSSDNSSVTLKSNIGPKEENSSSNSDNFKEKSSNKTSSSNSSKDGCKLDSSNKKSSSSNSKEECKLGNSKSNSKEEESILYLPKILISDGKINKNPLTRVNKDTAWIERELKKYGIYDIKTVLIALYDTQGNFKYQLFDEYEKENKE